MAPVNSKIVQGISSDDQNFALGSDVDFKSQNGIDSPNELSLNGANLNGNLQNDYILAAFSNGITSNDTIKNGIMQNGNNKLYNFNKTDKTDDDDDEVIVDKLENIYSSLLGAIGEDVNRNGIKRTPRRAAKAMVDFTKGYKQTVAGKCDCIEKDFKKCRSKLFFLKKNQ